MAIKTFTNDKWVVAKVESQSDIKKYATGAKWEILHDETTWNKYFANGDIFLLKNKEDKSMFAYQPATKLLADQNNNKIDVDKFFNDNPDVKDAFNDNKTELDSTGITKPESTTPATPVAESMSLDDIYKSMLSENKRKQQKYDITPSTSKLISKATPRGTIVTGLERELFDIDPELMLRLPKQSVELFQHALVNLLTVAKDDPRLMQSLRQMIRNQIEVVEDEVVGDESENKFKNEAVIASFKDTMKQITEANATRFNYKVLLDIDINKINDPQFVSLLSVFDLLNITRMQKQGIMMLLKKLAEIADTNPQIAQALTRIVRLENTKNTASTRRIHR